MQFYTKIQQHYCGTVLHTLTLYVCILNQTAVILVHHNIKIDQGR